MLSLIISHKMEKLENQNIFKKDKSVEFVKDKCIKCTKCVQKCNSIGICHLKMSGEGKDRYVDFVEENPCVNCGQCTLVCPVNVMREQSYIDEVERVLQDKSKIVIAQCAPSVRSSINEIFKLDYSFDNEKKINTCLRLLGFSKIFDVNFGADITSIIEAEELIERLETGEHLPMFTACCPSWVNFVKLYNPELIDNLTTAMSPHIHSGMAYKTWWAEENNINPKDIVVVSIMPCVSKKDEVYEYDGIKAVDYSLTVREFGRMIKNHNIDFENVEGIEGDSLSKYTGGAVIYGKSGGVMESALRVAKMKLENKEFEGLDFKIVEEDGYNYREAEVKVAEKLLKIAVISNPVNFKKFINTEKYKNYHYIEVMNCKGGCINGGGQPLLPPKAGSEDELISKRKQVLEGLDTGAKKKVALDNEEVVKYLDWAKDKDFRNSLFYVNHNEYVNKK